MPQANTIYTDITIIVVRPNLRQAAEDAAVAADPEGGAGTFIPGAPLRFAGDASNTVAAYWCQWNMKREQRSAFASSMGGPMNIIAAGGKVNAAHDSWMFDATDGAWTAEQVLQALGFDRMAPVDI